MGTIADGLYRIYNKSTGKVLEVRSSVKFEVNNHPHGKREEIRGEVDEHAVVQLGNDKCFGQIWHIARKEASPGQHYYVIKNFRDDTALDQDNTKPEPVPPRMQTYTHHGGPNQQWKFEAVGDFPGFYWIKRHGGLACLDVVPAGGKDPNKNQITLRNGIQGEQKQMWSLKKVAIQES